MIQKIFDENCAIVQLDTEYKIIEILWKKFATTTQYRQVIQVASDTIISQGVHKWLSDMSQAGVVSRDNQKWLKEDIIPNIIDHGLEQVAIVVSVNIFNKLYINNIKEELALFSTQYFDNIEDARKWLQSP